MQNLKIKVCGMRQSQNILALVNLQPDFIGFIFYKKSVRYVLAENSLKTIKTLPKTIKKVGVFVNEEIVEIKKLITEFDLDYVQLHGSESPEFCKQLFNDGIKIIKAFSVDNNFDFDVTNAYNNCTTMFLFDTKGESHGGHGVSFDWNLLKKNNQDFPYLLAGGISLENIDELLKLEDKNLLGIDVNSKFEVLPGLKDIEALENLFEKIRKI
jgi:phosphoribosylanthranilate isomerase